MKRCLIALALPVLLAACAPVPAAPTREAVLFPTMTPGRLVEGPLPPAAPPPAAAALANPATAIALSNLPTPTPNTTACPAPDAALSPDSFLQGGPPRTAAQISDAIGRFLSAGGTAEPLRAALQERWAALGGGFVRADLDLTGDGTPELIISYRAPDAGGSLLIFGCNDGRVVERYQSILSEDGRAAAPQILSAGDLNQSGRPDLLFSALVCADDGQDCQSITQLTAWDAARGRFLNLLGSGVLSPQPPSPLDIDADRVSELIVRLTDAGGPGTGPLRTGQIVYDWDGAQYVRSYTQYDPPRFRIQMVHDADAAFRAGRTRDATALYELAISSPALENWLNDDQTTLSAYARYRLLLAYADTEDPRLLQTHADILQRYPDLAAAPVYAEMAVRFWDALQASANLNTACAAVQQVIAARPEAVGLLNRYGSASPVAAAVDLCPY